MNTNKKIKLLGAILGIVLFIIAIAGVTYAWVSWRSENANISGNTECFNINYTNGQSLSTNNIYLFDESKVISNNKILIKDGMGLLNVTVALDSACNIMANYVMELNVTNISNAYTTGNSVGAFKYALASYDPTTYTDISQLKGQSLDIIKNDSITSTGTITFDAAILESTAKGYLLVFYVDGDLAQNDTGGATFKATITGTVTQTE